MWGIDRRKQGEQLEGSSRNFSHIGLFPVIKCIKLVYLPIKVLLKDNSLFLLNFWILFYFLYSRFLLVIYFIDISV